MGTEAVSPRLLVFNPDPEICKRRCRTSRLPISNTHILVDRDDWQWVEEKDYSLPVSLYYTKGRRDNVPNLQPL
jgi:hypothetical protein